jgi:hypothetical protein
MHRLNDDQLVNCYLEALKLELDNEFLKMLHKEINKRNMSLVLDNNSKHDGTPHLIDA